MPLTGERGRFFKTAKEAKTKRNMSERGAMKRGLETRKAKLFSLVGVLFLCTAAAGSPLEAPHGSKPARLSGKSARYEGSFSPVKVGSRLTSRFGMRCGRRGTKSFFHAGIDFQAERGDPVFAARAGVVDIIARNADRRPGFRGYGNAVVIYHPDEDLWSFYAHLDTVGVHRGQVVAAGENVGTAGNSSNGKFKGMGVHLHFEVRKRARKGRKPFPGRYRVHNIDPEKWLASHGVNYDERGRLITGPPRVARVLTERAWAYTHREELQFRRIGSRKNALP